MPDLCGGVSRDQVWLGPHFFAVAKINSSLFHQNAGNVSRHKCTTKILLRGVESFEPKGQKLQVLFENVSIGQWGEKSGVTCSRITGRSLGFESQPLAIIVVFCKKKVIITSFGSNFVPFFSFGTFLDPSERTNLNCLDLKTS